MDERKRALNTMCIKCQHLNICCDGSHDGNEVYTGCVLRDVDHDTAAAYIENMTELIYGKARMTRKTEEGKK